MTTPFPAPARSPSPTPGGNRNGDLETDDLDRLVVRARDGDRDAFRDLVLATQRAVTIAIAAHAVSRDMIDEVLQETYVTAFEKLGQYRLEGSFVPWLKAIARHRLYLFWRERRRIASLDGDTLDDLVAAEGLDALEADDDVQRRQAERLAACLERLPRRARLLLERRYCDELPLPVLARQFKRTTANLSVMLFRLRQRLRACVDGAEGT